MSHRRLKKTYLYIRRANKQRVVLLLAACFLAIVVVVLGGFLLIQDLALSDQIFPGVTIDGNAVGTMSRQQATAMVSNTIVTKIQEPLGLTYKGNTYKLNLAKIGLSVDVNKMVDEAFKKGQSVSIVSRMMRRFLNKPITADVPVILKYDQAQVQAFVANIASDLDYAARNASIDMSKGYPVVTSARDGRGVQQDELLKEIVAILPRAKRQLQIPVAVLKPKRTESDIGTIIVIKQSEHKLYQYSAGKLVDSYACATGTPQYPTPNGTFEILEKKKDPWWYPPKSAWAKDKKPIPPGPGNPLGPYFMDLGDGFGIHATPDEASLGYSASHGCVRLSEWSAQQVFKAVEKGTPVYILP
jgi:lipoprotein-anchoring transpeptidase ErfK/SrfK